MDFGTVAGYASQGLQILSSAKSLFGGGDDDGGMSNKEYAKQFAWSAKSAREMPAQQVIGMRAAGLNPMLLATKGLPPAPGYTVEPGLETKMSTAKQVAGTQAALAAASIANQSAQAKLYEAQAENVQADTLVKQKQPANIEAQTGLYRSTALMHDITGTLVGQQSMTETERTKLVKAEAFLKDFEAKVVQQYGPAKADLIFRQIKAATQEGETAAATAKGLEDAYKNIPPELVSTIRIIRSIFHPGSPGRYLSQ